MKVLLVGKDSPLAGSKRVSVQDLGGFIEIAHADSHVPGVAMDEIQKDELTDGVGRKIFVFDRAGRQIARCRKTHLFDIAVDGGMSL